MKRSLFFFGLALLLACLVAALCYDQCFPAARAVAQPAATISGYVIDQAGLPVAGANVRIQASDNFTISGSDGTFSLEGLAQGTTLAVSAWKDGYYCAIARGVTPPASGVTLTLRLYQSDDNPAYTWIPPSGDNSCYSCKPGVTQIWLDNDAHARSGSNARFLSLYNGTDLSGTTLVSPGYKLDFPGTSGNCATCHAPAAALDAPFTTDMSLLGGLDRDFGIHCDFCHKVAGVYLNPADNLPYANAPGVLSMDVRRPFPESERYQLFFGTFDDDNVPEEDTYLPLIEKSQWCAPCHQFSFWGVPIYQSYREWLDSAYPARGVECQTCHMSPDGIMTNVAPGMGGVARDPLSIHAHTMPGAANAALLANTVTITATAQAVAGRIQVDVSLLNSGAGHHVPTDHPGRQMILSVIALDAQGQPLAQLDGEQISAWGGPQAGLPGKAYAKVLRDALSGAEPVDSYWKQTVIVSDNRLPALGSDSSQYTFAAPPSGGEVSIVVELRFRRNYWDPMALRGWQETDIVMEAQEINLSVSQGYRLSLPLVVRD